MKAQQFLDHWVNLLMTVDEALLNEAVTAIEHDDVSSASYWKCAAMIVEPETIDNSMGQVPDELFNQVEGIETSEYVAKLGLLNDNPHKEKWMKVVKQIDDYGY